ncbi:Cytochrome P450 78A6 [Hibiscus syriacus]|uniref:Cytochrome P450 78A6 n=1 Tax=Hibiscus syriacus TaxID=106335 RepID=A0A6A2X8M0_HIBSY|nr:Cytochrome P450 78A6 [Hibiscus syriacus]
MRSDFESVWVFALASKCRAFSQETEESIACSILIIALLWQLMALVYWSYSSGSAWGKYRLKKCATLSVCYKPIPGPRGFPLIGSMNLMASSLAHHKIAAAAETCKAKRLMAFSLGDTRVIVTCTSDVAREILNSSVFADRPVKESAYNLMFNRAIGFAPYGVYWRTLRRIAATHLFCPKQIKGSDEQRRLIASEMVTLFSNKHNPSFHIPDVLKRASLNNMMVSIFGRKYKLDCADSEVDELRALVDEGLAPFGSGRRTCPGKNLGLTTVTFWVATLLHEFEWQPSDQNPVD